MKNNGDTIQFIKQKDYIMVNNDLGGGSFGKTVLLQDPFIDELFVAKKYEPECEEIKEHFYKNFLDEIKILYKLNHRNVVRIYNYYAYSDIYTGYILMEYIDGRDIGTYIHDYFPAPFDDTSIDEVFVQLIDAFCYIEAHGIIHRDIREGNILIDRSGLVKVIDFGIGKVYEKAENAEDSLALQINRDGSDTLPQEYYEGIYTSQTDQFYLAELLNRLISNAENKEYIEFSYQYILDRMMQKKAEDRYASFAEVRDAIEEHDFLKFEISEKDKEIYQNFSGKVFESLSWFDNERKFNYDTEIFISKLEKALRNNLFENCIQKNEDVIGAIVLGQYHYDNQVYIACDVVKDFLNWFKSSTKESKDLIISNLIGKLSSIKVEVDGELPF